MHVERIRRAERLDALAGGLVADHDLLDLRDLLVADLQAQRDQRGGTLVRIAVILFDGAEERDLSRRHVGHEQTVMALRAHRVPESIADRELLAVFRETHVGRERHRARLICDHGIEVAIDEALEARSIAVRSERDIGEGTQGDGRERSSADSNGLHSPHQPELLSSLLKAALDGA